jgi:hypothetical protein
LIRVIHCTILEKGNLKKGTHYTIMFDNEVCIMSAKASPAGAVDIRSAPVRR